MIKTLLTTAAILLATQASAEKLTRVDLDSGKAILVIADDFIDGTADRVDTFLLMNPDIREVAFNSDGGIASEGVDLADILYDHDIKTTVNTGYHCLSACAFAFIGGSDFRIDGILGFHNGYIPYPAITEMSRDQITNVSIYMGALTTNHFVRNGFSIELPLVISATTSKETYIVFTETEDLYDFVVGEMVSDIFTDIVDAEWVDRHLWPSVRLAL